MAERGNQIFFGENYVDLQLTGLTAAFVPDELGGLNLLSVHGWILAIAILGKGDGSTAMAISMYLSTTRGLAEIYRNGKSRSPSQIRTKSYLEDIAN